MTDKLLPFSARDLEWRKPVDVDLLRPLAALLVALDGRAHGREVFPELDVRGQPAFDAPVVQVSPVSIAHDALVDVLRPFIGKFRCYDGAFSQALEPPLLERRRADIFLVGEA